MARTLKIIPRFAKKVRLGLKFLEYLADNRAAISSVHSTRTVVGSELLIESEGFYVISLRCFVAVGARFLELDGSSFFFAK